MSAFNRLATILAMSWTPVIAAAAQFDGSQPLECNVLKGHDCLPTQNRCGPLQSDSDRAPIFAIDAAKKAVRSPYREALLPIVHVATTRELLVLQGFEKQFAWSANVNKTTGAMTIAVADRKGAYVAFGQCKVAGTR